MPVGDCAAIFIELVGRLIVAVEIDVGESGERSVFNIFLLCPGREFIWLTELRALLASEYSNQLSLQVSSINWLSIGK